MENAILKARHYARRSGLLTVADDSGLSVDALGGAPGLYSSRFGGEGATDADRNRLLLEKLRGRARRAARRAVHERGGGGARARPCCSRPRRRSKAGSRTSRGDLTASATTPLFFYPPFGRTFGEAAPEDKDRVSHRGQGVRAPARVPARALVRLNRDRLAFLSGTSPTTAFWIATSSRMPLSAAAISDCELFAR